MQLHDTSGAEKVFGFLYLIGKTCKQSVWINVKGDWRGISFIDLYDIITQIFDSGNSGITDKKIHQDTGDSHQERDDQCQPPLQRSFFRGFFMVCSFSSQILHENVTLSNLVLYRIVSQSCAQLLAKGRNVDTDGITEAVDAAIPDMLDQSSGLMIRFWWSIKYSSSALSFRVRDSSSPSIFAFLVRVSKLMRPHFRQTFS